MSQVGIEKDLFGVTADGTPVERYTLRNGRGAMVRLITFGATVTELHVPDARNEPADVVLGFDDLAQYETDLAYMGRMVGRVAFRIAGAEFELDGRRHQLTRNDSPHHLHGGTRGFSFVVWQAEPVATGPAPVVKFAHRSADGDQGYPGTMDVTVVYTLSEENELRIEAAATSDRPTLVNLTHHSYFNLAGAGSGDVLGHVVQLDADRWLPDAPSGVPSGEIASVKGTPYDFTRPTPLGARIGQAGGEPPGYDLCYLLDRGDAALARAAMVFEPSSRRRMEVLTTEPAIVLYTANYLDGSLRGKGGVGYGRHAAVCLETGRPPDAVHQPQFPATVLRPGETYRHTCVYRFSAD
jgi:aldose 1-epimerase